MISKSILFVCGTPSNKGGFEYHVLNNKKLPGEPSSYLDAYDNKRMKEGKTYILQKVFQDEKAYTILAEYRPINPSDNKNSRGAYIGVGVAIEQSLTIDDSVQFFILLAEIHGALFALRDNRNSFSEAFKLKDFSFPVPDTGLHGAYLVDSFCRASFTDDPIISSSNKIIYNDFKNSNKVISERLHYISMDGSRLVQEKDLGLEINSLQEDIKCINHTTSNIFKLVSENEKKVKTQKNNGAISNFASKHFNFKLAKHGINTKTNKLKSNNCSINNRKDIISIIFVFMLFILVIIAVHLYTKPANKKEGAQKTSQNAEAIKDKSSLKGGKTVLEKRKQIK